LRVLPLDSYVIKFLNNNQLLFSCQLVFVDLILIGDLGMVQ